MNIRVCALRLWLLLHVAALNRHLCSSQHWEENVTPDVAMGVEGIWTPEAAPSWQLEDASWREYQRRRYFYAHNETQIAMASAEAEARTHDAGGTTGFSSFLGSARFLDFAPSEDGCRWNSMRARDLSFYNSDAFEVSTVNRQIPTLADEVQILAVESCSKERVVALGNRLFEFCSQRWVWEKPDTILIWDDPRPLTRSLKMLVRMRIGEREVLADGVYLPATGTMHLVGCTRGQQILPDFSKFSATSIPPTSNDFVLSRAEMMNVTLKSSEVPTVAESPEREELDGTRSAGWYVPRMWDDPDDHHEPPLNSSTFQDCAISATLQYPPLNCLWNSDRVLKYSLRSIRAKDDPLYFAPIDRSALFSYFSSYYNSERPIWFQRRLETGGRIVLLVLGLVCVALQIEHGRKHEESLPFVSLVMLSIQLAHHLSQTSMFRDLQIGIYYSGIQNHDFQFGDQTSDDSSLDSIVEFQYYATMAWRKHVPYQAMAMAAIFMYVWVFHKVSERRRIMQLRVIRNRPGAKDPPSDWRVMNATLAFLGIVLFVGFLVIGADHYDNFRRELTGMTAAEDNQKFEYQLQGDDHLAPGNTDEESVIYPPGFVSSRLYELSQAQWGFVNRLAGLVVSFFLVPQLLGNREWQAHGQHPLSAWFYAGIPFLQSLPHVFSIAKHFQLLPIFPPYDPYINSVFGIFENPTPWWQIAVVLCSTLQVLAVHSQFSRLPIRGSRQYPSPNTSPHDAQSLDVL